MTNFVILLLIFVIPSMAFAGEVRYSAMVMDVKGTVTVLHGGKNKSADLGYVLYSGDEVKLAMNASLTIDYLESGQEEVWSAGKKFVVGRTASNLAPAKVNKKNKIALPSMEFQATGTHVMRFASTPEINVKGLSNTQIMERRPVFRWDPIESAEIYRISLRSNDKSLIWEKMTTASELSYPEDMMPLEYGTRYEWEIEAINNGEDIADKSSCFSLPGESEIDGIRKQLEIYNGQLSNDSNKRVNHLSQIMYLKQNLLYDDALEQYQELQKVHGKSLSIDEAEQRIIKIRKASCKPLTKE